MMFRMEHYTITAPKVRNDGEPSGYVIALRAALKGAGIDGWTEQDSVGVWRGKAEPGTVFTVYLSDQPGHMVEQRLSWLGVIARRVMPDQEAVQVTHHGTITLHEG
jgi:hypothetical protein